MKIVNLALCFVLGSSLLAGCVMDAGEESLDGSADEAALADDGAGEASELRAIDGRSAAELEAKVLGIRPTNASLATWFSGTISAGGTSHHYWNNAGSAVYAVGISPIGASTTHRCSLEITRTWDVQHYGGEREFHFVIKNVGSIACGGNILLEGHTPSGSFASAGIEPGKSRGFTWNNANPLTSTHYVNVAPSGASPSNSCKLELTRQYYFRQSTGERELRFTIANIGAIACQGTILIGRAPDQVASWASGSMAAGASSNWYWNNANPLTRIYAPGLVPAIGCAMEIPRSYYSQVINSNGTAEREFHWVVKNVDTTSCSATVLLNHADD